MRLQLKIKNPQLYEFAIVFAVVFFSFIIIKIYIEIEVDSSFHIYVHYI